MTRTEISNLVKRNRSADQIARALDNLLKLGRVRWELDKDTGGRAAERWFAR
jgi:predicted transcriptional regulator